MSLRVLACGSRDWTDRRMVYVTLNGLWEARKTATYSMEVAKFVLIEGGAPGADTMAREWTKNLHGHYDFHPPYDFEHLPFDAEWDVYGKRAGPIRNRQMLSQGKPDLVVAFKDNLDITEHGSGRGTEDMVRIAKDAGVEVWHLHHI